MDNIPDMDSEHTPRSTLSAESMSLRTSFRDTDDQALLASFLGTNSELLHTNTVSLTSLMTANKAPFQVESGRRRRTDRWEDSRRPTFTLDTTNEASIDRRALSAMSRNKSPSDSSCNIGNSLYFKGLQMKENVKRRVQQFVRQRTEEEKEYFRPKLDDYSYRMKPRQHDSIEEALLTWGSKKDEKLARMKSVRSQEELQICSFAPKLDSKSLQITQQKRAGKPQPRFLELYQMALQQREQQGKTRTADCSFHPRIFVEKKVPENRSQFIDRLYTSKNRPGEVSRKKDSETESSEGQPQHFVRPPRKDRPNSMPIHEFLYSLREKHSEAASSPAPQPPENPASRKVFDRFQNACISNLFSVLDDDRDGQLSGYIEAADMLDDKQRAVLAPVLQEIEESEETWSFEHFEKRMSELINRLNVEERGYLLTRVKPRYLSPEPEQVRKAAPWTSPVLATARASRVIPTQKSIQAKEQIEKDRKAKEVRECPFKPFLTSLETQRYVANKSIY